MRPGLAMMAIKLKTYRFQMTSMYVIRVGRREKSCQKLSSCENQEGNFFRRGPGPGLVKRANFYLVQRSEC